MSSSARRRRPAGPGTPRPSRALSRKPRGRSRQPRRRGPSGRSFSESEGAMECSARRGGRRSRRSSRGSRASTSSEGLQRSGASRLPHSGRRTRPGTATPRRSSRNTWRHGEVGAKRPRRTQSSGRRRRRHERPPRPFTMTIRRDHLAQPSACSAGRTGRRCGARCLGAAGSPMSRGSWPGSGARSLSTRSWLTSSSTRKLSQSTGRRSPGRPTLAQIWPRMCRHPSSGRG
mmetsp:Transcript_130723/g.378206  ORF Transcript_130723/g.378206 Transcript_130723/m.378206 type:complete len:231 (+) Transcript_130723:273-965(+)